jgi:hypothetical protein
MFGRTFYYGSIKKYVTLFGTLFNDVWVKRRDSNGDVKQAFKVPLSYSPREKMLSRIEGDPNLNKQFATILPRMGFEITGITYAAERKLTTINKFAKTNRGSNTNIDSYLFNPVPYDITFSLSIFVKNAEDGTMIVEQILPYFTPEWTTTVEIISDPKVVLDIPLVLNDVTQDDVYEGSYEERRSLIWTINFTMKAFFFGPIKRDKVIKLANVNFFELDSDNYLSTIDIFPGLDANGNPTTDVNETIPYDQIKSTDDWDYIVQIENPNE